MAQMIRRVPEPRALQRDRLARVVRDRDADEVPIPDDAARRIEVDPAGSGNVDLDPGVGVAAGITIVVVIVVWAKCTISGNEPRGDAARAQCSDHEHCEVATTPAPEIEGADRILDPLLVPRDVLERPSDGLRHVDEQVVRVGGSVFAEEARAPAIEFGVRGPAAG